ncbi:MAG: DUF4838 domain-containing protein [Bacteroidota bacterium]|jgi:hypothetical protein|nr:MAG: DUF4838 domain-containing protein [Bacteroidota bacterium]
MSIAWRMMKEGIRSVAVLLLILTLTIDNGYAQRKKQRQTQPPERIVLADEGATRYRIVLPSSPSEHEKQAAEVLRRYLLQISGTAFPIVGVQEGRSRYEIVLGQNERLDELRPSIDFNALGDDGFIIRTDSLRLLIASGPGKGTLYGVYTFLEKYLGCRMYSPSVKIIPERTRIELPEIDDKQVPAIKFRTTHYRVAWDKEYVDWHKLDHDETGERPDWGMWVHTFAALVPPDVYAKDHPEYYALVDGKRIPTQLCLTNPDVLDITVRNLRRFMARNPEATYWSVSQNDNRQYCTCEACTAINEREGSPSGSIINFVNQVADQFPDKIISTLAYEYSRKAPANIKPRDNVNIMLCSIEVGRDKPIATDSASADFRRDVEDWGKIAKDIIVWDYVIQFNHLVSPFPNFHVLQPNIKFFVDHGVTAMFEQGNREVGGEFAELRAYLISKLLWNPDEDVDALMDDFLSGYYGPAGPFIRKYIDKMTEALLASGKPLRIFGSPLTARDSYLTPELIKEYEALFDKAQAAVADAPHYLERVKIARLPLEYAIVEQAKETWAGDNGLFVRQDDQWVINEDIRRRIDPFVDLCIRHGVTQLKEWSTSPEAWRASTYRLYSLGMKEHLAYGKKVTFNSPDTTKLPLGATTMLTDGKRGGHDYAYNWLAFPGVNLDVVVDLGEVKKVRHIESAYFQYAMWLRLFPRKVEYQISTDGKKFTTVAEIENTLPIDQYDGYQRDFVARFGPQDARYVRVIAHTIGNTPEWHPGAGRPAYMLVDEIVVE